MGGGECPPPQAIDWKGPTETGYPPSSHRQLSARGEAHSPFPFPPLPSRWDHSFTAGPTPGGNESRPISHNKNKTKTERSIRLAPIGRVHMGKNAFAAPRGRIVKRIFICGAFGLLMFPLFCGHLFSEFASVRCPPITQCFFSPHKTADQRAIGFDVKLFLAKQWADRRKRSESEKRSERPPPPPPPKLPPFCVRFSAFRFFPMSVVPLAVRLVWLGT